jgi:hypothetical protein
MEKGERGYTFSPFLFRSSPLDPAGDREVTKLEEYDTTPNKPWADKARFPKVSKETK